LITLGLVSSNDPTIRTRFIKNCVECRLEESTLLQLLLKLLERVGDSQVSEFVPQVKFILRSLSSNDNARKDINARIEHLKTLCEENENTGDIKKRKRESDLQEKERKGKERKAKLLARIQNTQNQFIRKNVEDFESSSLERIVDDKNLDYESGQCLVCHEDADCSSPLYGILVSMHPSNLPQVCTLKNQDDIFDLLQESTDPVLLHESTQRKTMNDPNGGLYISTCSHLIHLTCFERLPNAINSGEFVCPLCKSLCNGVLPVLWEKKCELKITNGEEQSFTDWWTSGNLQELSSVNQNNQGQLLARFAGQIPRLNAILHDNTTPGVWFLNIPVKMHLIDSSFMNSVKKYIGIYDGVVSNTMKTTCMKTNS
jgi:hypothetical protein